MTRTRRPRSFDEADAVGLFAARFGSGRASTIRLGIGDDAAVLSPPPGKLVWTVDACVEGSHFERSLLSLEDVGWKSFHAAASDLAAMGALPIAALSALELPAGFSRDELDELATGQALAARSARCPIVGGNMARSEKLSVTTTLLGRAYAPLTRAAARPGEELWLVGDVGLAAAGFALLRSGKRARGRGVGERCVHAWRRPEALLKRGQALVGRASAAIDVSDGLAGDVAHLGHESGVKVVIEAALLEHALAPELVALSAKLDKPALDFALYGGEDYALLATGPAARRPRFARRIGRVERGRGAFLESAVGTLSRLGAGFDHLTPRST
jgi:thiamine-monophosphate kinase